MDTLNNDQGTERRRLGEWLPSKESQIAEFRIDLAAKAYKRSRPQNNAVVELERFILGDAVVRMDFTRAIHAAQEAGYQLGYSTVEEFALLLDYMMTYAPPFSDSGLIHCPVNALLDWPMCMPSGYALLRDPALNAHLKRVLNVWGGYLSGPHSRTHLNTSTPQGWFSDAADQKIGLSQFVLDKEKPFWGFSSWNHFFTREFLPGARPVAEPGDSKLIVNACEAAPYALAHDVQYRDSFWIKSQPYSLVEILTEREQELARSFVGGTIYQAFLSAFNYHRWHAPVDGTITKSYLVDGTYYSDAESEGEDPSSLNDSQGYTCAVAARAVIIIEAKDRRLGTIACVFVGMAEVSSCVIEALPGQQVSKGDELGYFQYGGSTYCLIFQPGVIDRFIPAPPFNDEGSPLKINAPLAIAR